MKDKCNICFNNIEKASGCYITPSGIFCVLCYERNEVLKYKRLERHVIHSAKAILSTEKNIIDIDGGFQLY